MRSLIYALGGLAFMASGAPALAQQRPLGVQTIGGALADATGKPLYVWEMDTMKGMSHCNDDCAQAWPPLVAKAGAKPVGAWSLIKREDGSVQWTYNDKPVYTFANDMPGQPPKGAAIPHWSLVK